MTDAPPIPEPGIYPGVPFAEYEAWDAFHSSAASSLLRSPLHWQWDQSHPHESEVMRFGGLVDCLLFEPGEFDVRFAVRPTTYETEVTKGRGANKTTERITKPWTMQSNTCKAIAADLEASGKAIISAADVAIAKDVEMALREHPMVADWLTRGQFQVSILWIDEETGVLCKARLDILVEPAEMQPMGVADLLIADLKVTNNADRGPFRRTMTTFGWHVQAGLYQDAYSTLNSGLAPPFYLIAAEPAPPHGVAVYPIGPDSLASGLNRARAAMAVWKGIRQTGEIVGYPVFNDDLDVMPWALDREVLNV